ncbi:hypothetical protein GCM10010193_49020 [Kitasatospora atroaurantiaca]|uniref:TadE-like protein n=1 Tax=Kitasatospora atroaurantiaca TaxID=285545 RepID=A0A561EYN4_9ACTN|nr:TadE/TadG family type IV pilus assembly protein [Kitasatospora atroaurantiaca]TWE20720.1 TadE-like protein [Kitasatospora atroaurantiaca]
MTLSLAIIFPVVLFMVMLVVQASLWWYANQAALTAAREGADAGRIQGGTREAGDRRATDFLRRLGSLAEPVEVNSGDTDDTTFRMTITVRPQSVVPGLENLTVTQHVSAPREKFVPQGGKP